MGAKGSSNTCTFSCTFAFVPLESSFLVSDNFQCCSLCNKMVASVIFAVIFLIFGWSLIDKWKGYRIKRPPGPFRLPVLGNLHAMIPSVMNPVGEPSSSWGLVLLSKFCGFKPAFSVFHRLSQKYGPIMSIKFGVSNGVIIGNSKLAREVFCREEFADRYAQEWFTERSFGKPLGLIFNNGPAYKKIKNFTVKNLKDFGLGKTQKMEVAVDEELEDFLSYFRTKLQENGNVVEMNGMFVLAVLNILWKMMAGTRFSYGDEKLLKLISYVEELSRSFDIGGNILMAFPFLRIVAPGLTGHEHQMGLYEKLQNYFREILNERQNAGEAVGNAEDFIDIFREKIQSNGTNKNNNNNNEEELFTDEQFIMVCLDLFTAGADTTANTLDFAMLYMILNPNVQERIQEEIDQVIGRHRLPSMDDRQKMPYTEATLLEVQRMCNVIPLVHRICTRDTEVDGYHISEGDIMVVNLHSVHMDETVWEKPEDFNPERFLDANNGRLNSSSNFLPFGMGKRVCIGEIPAKMALFKYFVAMLQNFELSIPPGHAKPSAHPGRGFTVCPYPYCVYVRQRV